MPAGILRDIPEVDSGAAAKLEAFRNFGPPTGAEVY
jgi:hypothetical protein